MPRNSWSDYTIKLAGSFGGPSQTGSTMLWNRGLSKLNTEGLRYVVGSAATEDPHRSYGVVFFEDSSTMVKLSEFVTTLVPRCLVLLVPVALVWLRRAGQRAQPRHQESGALTERFRSRATPRSPPRAPMPRPTGSCSRRASR